MTSYVSVELRRLVESRANGICEYCLIHMDDTYLGCQVEHIIAEKHGGLTEPDNLGWACACCNRAKGSDIGSIASSDQQYTRFFNPRTDRWSEHFALKDALILSLTPVGEVTAGILRFNTASRVFERKTLTSVGRYPPAEAAERLAGISR